MCVCMRAFNLVGFLNLYYDVICLVRVVILVAGSVQLLKDGDYIVFCTGECQNII